MPDYHLLLYPSAFAIFYDNNVNATWNICNRQGHWLSIQIIILYPLFYDPSILVHKFHQDFAIDRFIQSGMSRKEVEDLNPEELRRQLNRLLQKNDEPWKWF